MTHILAPCDGRTIPLSRVPDPVFAEQQAGPGVGIEPAPVASAVLSPVDGTLVSLRPHAFIILVDGEVGILVHIGINTVRLDGAGFTLLAEEGQQVRAGTPVIEWNPAEIVGPEVSTIVVVTVMDGEPDSITSLVEGAVSAGDLLFVV